MLVATFGHRPWLRAFFGLWARPSGPYAAAVFAPHEKDFDSTMEFKLFSTCPESDRVDPEHYLRNVQRTARLCEQLGHEALVIHNDHRLMDPWAVAQVVLHATRRLRPVVTVQPLHLHPYATAKKVITLTQLYGRCPDLVFAADLVRGDGMSLGDRMAQDERYRRLTEHALLVRRLLSSGDTFEHLGEFYRLEHAIGIAALRGEDMPRFFVAGGSEAGRVAAAAIGGYSLRHPSLATASDEPLRSGDCVRLGIVARPQAAAAWQTATERFRVDPQRRLEHRLEMHWSDSTSHRQLQISSEAVSEPYWLQPFENRLAQCAYLVGDYRTVARELRGFFDAGVRWFFLDAPGDVTELRHTGEVFRRAWGRFASPLRVGA